MKRKHRDHAGDRPRKRPNNTCSQCALATSPQQQQVDHPVLRRLYPDVLSLRHHVLSRLPSTSKNRRRKIAQLGRSQGQSLDAVDSDLARLLDSALVGTNPKPSAASREEAIRAREIEITSFSQQLLDCATDGTFTPGYYLQGEVRCLSPNPHSFRARDSPLP
jgi:hypothetical protein